MGPRGEPNASQTHLAGKKKLTQQRGRNTRHGFCNEHFNTFFPVDVFSNALYIEH